MVRLTRSAVAILACVSLSGAFAAGPRVLIVQTRVPVKRGEDDSNRPLANFLASQFDESAKLEAIVYSLTDPVYRNAALEAKLADPKANVSLDEAQSVAKKLNAEYLIMLQAFKDGGKYRAKLELFRGTKSIWKDDQNVQVTLAGGSAPEDSLRSLASTMAARINQEPLKGLAAKPTITTPPPDPGQNPALTVVNPPPPVKKDNAPVIKESRDLLAAGKANLAVARLRDAVDSDPLDSELRISLIDALMTTNPAGAGAEARAAANLMPEVPGLRVMAARAWLVAGQPDEAQKDLNEAVSRNPEASESRVLLGEVAIRQLKPDAAMEHLDKAISVKDSGEARFLRALASAMLGKTSDDLDALAKLEPNPSPADLGRRNVLAADALDRLFQSQSNDVRSLIQRAVVKPDDKATLDAVGVSIAAAQALAAFCDKAPVTAGHAKSSQSRGLAFRLLAQSASGIQAYMGGGGDDALAGARIDLGEAIRNAAEARAAG